MLLGKVFTSLAFAAMAIAPAASAPTAEPGATTVLVKRTTIGDHARSCYSGVQVHCDYINNHIHDHGGIITVDVAATILVELDAILALIVTLVGQITGEVLVQITIISGSLILTIDGLLGLILGLLSGILGSLRLDIDTSIDLFNTASGYYH
ncbi:uncharacterized protein K444DRAFT_636002 [Hyaloscypha bicolor E]|uniref:Uncharacterized protein n=1 Tax=Hyaloscypha bicolor E TaxID=1095630 RepID=A0A2J6SQQ9_9HELO|nr:uncharacterized protein K444DRAFT_636002 [Hyaloscypha bicolor E]PMD53102.1 hypothetical protein K444DRAFT_636002 [Hyaloscypha bicolor E]